MSAETRFADLHDRLFAFLEELRRSEFRIGVREHVAVRELCVALRAEGLDADLEGIGAWLAPIVCTSPGDQATFEVRWKEWVARQSASAPPPPIREPEAPIVRRWKRTVAAAAGVMIALVVGAIAWRASREPAVAKVAPDAADTSRSAPSTATAPTPAPTEPEPTEAISVVGWTRGFGPMVLAGHTGNVNSVAFSPDGKLVASGGEDGTVRLWSAEEGIERRQAVRRSGEVVSVAFSPDGELLASGAVDGSIGRWNVQLGGESGPPWGAHPNAVVSVAYLLDGALVAASKDGDRVRLRVFEESGDLRRTAIGTLDRVRTVAHSAEGSLVVAGGADGVIRLWSIESGAERSGVSMGRGSEVVSIALSPDGKLVAAGEIGGAIRLWSVEERVERGPPWIVPDVSTNSIAFSPDGKLVASAGDDGVIRLWSVEDRAAAERFLTGHSGPVLTVAFSPDGELIASGGVDGALLVWSLSAGVALGERLSIEPLADPLATFEGHDGAIGSATFSSDGARMLTAGRDRTARLFDRDGRELASLPRDVGPRPYAEFSPDGSRVLVTSDNTAKLLDQEGETYVTYRGHEDTVNLAVFSPDGARVLTASDDGTARMFDVTGEEQVVFRGHVGAVNGVAFSPTADRVVTAGADGTARVFDYAGAQLAVMRGHERALNSAVFSVDGMRIATSSDDHTARVFDLQGRELAVFRGHDGPVRSAVFSSSGENVLTASADGTGVVWDAQTREPLLSLRGHGAELNSAVFDPRDDRYVLTASNDGTARLWDARLTSTPSLAAAAAAIAAALAVFAMLRALLRRWALRGRPTRPGDVVRNVSLPAGVATTAHAIDARRQSIQLRRAALVGTADIDVERTVARTVESAGFVQVVRRGRPQTPEYLVLVERAGPRDHLARHFDERIGRLRAEGIHVERMSFRGEPSVVYSSAARGSFAALADVHARFPSHRVWAVGEARVVRSAIASDARWLEDLAGWRQRAYVVPDRADVTPDLGAALARHGIGLGALDDPAATLEEPGRTIAAPKARPAPFPPSLARDMERWRSPAAPEPHVVRAMLDELARYLGPALFRWCAACAVYPELHYEMTLQMARLVLPDHTVRDEEVVRLARLPWFRSGRMPDWLRRELLDALPREDEQRVRDWFLRVFTRDSRVSPGAESHEGARRENERAGLELPIALDARAAVRDEFRDLAAQERRDADADPALRDAVFLSWMDDRLSVAVPRQIARALRKRGREDEAHAPSIPRPWWRALLGALAAGFLLTCWRAYFGAHAEYVGLVALTPYAVLTAAARRFQAGGAVVSRVLLYCEIQALFTGAYIVPRAVASSVYPEMPDADDLFAGLVGSMTVLAWLVFELLALRARRLGGSTRFERIADGLMLDRLFEWLARDFSRGERPARAPSRPWLQLAITQVVVAAIVFGAWALERGRPPYEWAWASAGLLLAVAIGAPALSSSKIGARAGWLFAAAEVFCAWSTVLIASASLGREVDGAGGGLVAGCLAATVAILVAALSSLRRRRHPLFTAFAPLLAVCDALAVGRWVDEALAKRRESRSRTASEVGS